MKFGSIFLIYADDPLVCHAKYLVFIEKNSEII